MLCVTAHDAFLPPVSFLFPAQDSAQQHVGDCGTQQRKKRSGRAKPSLDQDTEALPDQAMESSSNQSTGLGGDNLKKKKSTGDRTLPDQATELGELQKKSGRSIRPRAVSDQAMMDAVISDSEQEEEEEEGSDAEFVAMSRGSKKVSFQKMSFTVVALRATLISVAFVETHSQTI